MKHWTHDEAMKAHELVGRRASDAECLAAVGRNFHACYVKVARWGERKRREPRKAPPARPNLYTTNFEL